MQNNVDAVIVALHVAPVGATGFLKCWKARRSTHSNSHGKQLVWSSDLSLFAEDFAGPGRGLPLDIRYFPPQPRNEKRDRRHKKAKVNGEVAE